MLVFERDILPYLQLGSDGKPPAQLRHAYYQASIDHRDHLRAVFGKKYPDYLDINRPKEQAEYKAYRKAIYKNPLRSLRRRVIEVLDYVRQADDFDVVFPQTDQTLTDGFEPYITQATATTSGSMLDWFFSNLRRMYVNDPNAVLVVLPMEQPASNTERVKPVPMLIPCEGVYQHRQGELAVLESPERVWIDGPMGRQKTGKVLIFVDHDSYCIARQRATIEIKSTAAKTDVRLDWIITGLGQTVGEDNQPVYNWQPPLHNCPVLPAVKIGKLQGDEDGISLSVKPVTDLGETYFESLLTDALPFVKDCQQIQSDIEVERNFHVSSQEWRYAQRRCPDSELADGPCVGGYKTMRDPEGMVLGKVPCQKCKGTGLDVSGSGIGLIVVSAPTATSLSDEGRPTNLPTPPGGFIPRSIEPLQEFVKEFERQKTQAYETINMQFLMQTPYDQSGVSKRYDREELYRELNTQGAHLCKLLRWMYEWAAWQRGQSEQIPSVLEPVRFNLENSELTREELEQAVKNSFDPNLRKPLEKKLISYQTGENSDYYRRYELKERLDPYPGMDNEQKLFMLASLRIALAPGSAEMQTCVERIWLSIHFDGLVLDEIRQNPAAFWGLKPGEQYERLLAAARKLVGKVPDQIIDPITGKVIQGAATLQPFANIKNLNQI